MSGATERDGEPAVSHTQNPDAQVKPLKYPRPYTPPSGDQKFYRRAVWCTWPPDVKEVLQGHFVKIGLVDDDTVLKYTFCPNPDVVPDIHEYSFPPTKQHYLEELEDLKLEAKIYEAVGPHPRIIGFRKFDPEAGIYLERAHNGSIENYLWAGPGPHHNPDPATRLRWCIEAAEGVAFLHARHVIHCDIRVGNLLLTSDLHVKICDLQSKLLDAGGNVLVDCLCACGPRYASPRIDNGEKDVRTDLFSLGVAFYSIMLGREPFAEIKDYDGTGGPDAFLAICDALEGYWRNGQWPPEEFVGREIAVRCWAEEYASAEEVLRDLRDLQGRLERNGWCAAAGQRASNDGQEPVTSGEIDGMEKGLIGSADGRTSTTWGSRRRWRAGKIIVLFLVIAASFMVWS
jgi:serine/threonine protein kinase